MDCVSVSHINNVYAIEDIAHTLVARANTTSCLVNLQICPPGGIHILWLCVFGTHYKHASYSFHSCSQSDLFITVKHELFPLVGCGGPLAVGPISFRASPPILKRKTRRSGECLQTANLTAARVYIPILTPYLVEISRLINKIMLDQCNH